MLSEEVFQKFCTYLDGKLRWSDKKEKFTYAMWDFFSDLGRQKPHIIVQKEYLGIDYVWLFEDFSRHLELAAEHENKYDAGFLTKEVQHLIDVKALTKIAITYPPNGEENSLVDNIRKMIKASMRLNQSEEYLVILGFSTSKRGDGHRKRAILFKAYYITQDGDLWKTEDRVVFQGRKTFLLRINAVDEKGRRLTVPFKIEKISP